MSLIDGLEGRRLDEQTKLDTLKTPAERNKWGQFATPGPLAISLARYARSLIGDGPIRFLDPAIGTGSFFSALLRACPRDQIQTAHGIELDPLFAAVANDLWGESGLKAVQGDFTCQKPPRIGFNLILTNPPYVRHHHLPAEEKLRFQQQLRESLNMSISGLAGLYCYFLLQAHDWMTDGGIGVWLIPSEFMDVNYGLTMRQYLTDRVTLLQIHRFCPTDVQFTDALVSSAVVIFRKSPPNREHAPLFTFGGSIESPQTQATVPLDTLRTARKWTQFPCNLSVRSNERVTLGDLFKIQRGLATGSNGFFILDQEQLREWEIPVAFVKPILPAPRNLPQEVVEAGSDGVPDLPRPLYLLDCSEPEHRIRCTWPRFYQYIERGKAEGIHLAYLARHRPVWYSQEQRPPAPFLCNYMGRIRNGKHPFRFIWNRSQATAHNVYLMLYPKGPLRDALAQHPELHAEVFAALRAIAPNQLVSEGRVYGGGLHKVEPKELAQVEAGTIAELIGPTTCHTAHKPEQLSFL